MPRIYGTGASSQLLLPPLHHPSQISSWYPWFQLVFQLPHLSWAFVCPPCWELPLGSYLKMLFLRLRILALGCFVVLLAGVFGFSCLCILSIALLVVLAFRACLCLLFYFYFGWLGAASPFGRRLGFRVRLRIGWLGFLTLFSHAVFPYPVSFYHPHYLHHTFHHLPRPRRADWSEGLIG